MTLSDRVLTAYGISGVLSKPCNAQELEDCLVKWCPGYQAQAGQRDTADHGRRGPRPDAALGSTGNAPG